MRFSLRCGFSLFLLHFSISLGFIQIACGGADDGAMSNEGSASTGGAMSSSGGSTSGGISGIGGALGGAASGGASGAGVGSGGSVPTNPPNLFFSASGLLEVWVNGTKVGSSSGAGELLETFGTLVAGQENIVAVRATKGAASSPAFFGELDGVFGKAGSSGHWRAKSAASSDELTGSAWAEPAYADGGWSFAEEKAELPSFGELAGGPARGIWTSSAADATALFRMHFYIPANWSVDEPLGLAKGVTGGDGGKVVTVTTTAELSAAVSSSLPLVIQVSGKLDYRGLEGKTTAKVCYQSQCNNGQFEYISNGLGACDSAGKSTFDYSFDTAGIKPLPVASNKTIIGLGADATILGKGFKLASGVTNVIIRNLTITEINPELIWGGDAIDLSGAKNVWIDHNRISLIGRQFLVSHYDANANITVSFNDFDGNTKYSATCNGAHYWDMLLLGNGDTMTLANNWIRQMSGRSPHVGGLATSNVGLHIVNEYHTNILGHACDAGTGGRAFYEGSYFDNVTTPVTNNTDGAVYAPLATTVSGTSASCNATLGRACIENAATGSISSFRLDTSALTGFAALADKMVTPYPANEVPNCVPHLAGPGHI